MTELHPSVLAQIAGGDCYNATIEVFGLEIGIRIGSCQMN